MDTDQYSNWKEYKLNYNYKFASSGILLLCESGNAVKKL